MEAGVLMAAMYVADVEAFLRSCETLMETDGESEREVAIRQIVSSAYSQVQDEMEQ
jgi:hypothetical protein